jgi:hypothetical protein
MDLRLGNVPHLLGRNQIEPFLPRCPILAPIGHAADVQGVEFAHLDQGQGHLPKCAWNKAIDVAA